MPLLYCLRCPVRRECLEEAFKPTTYSHGVYERTAQGETERKWRGLPQTQVFMPATTSEVRGVWGGTTEQERIALRKLPAARAIERLESRVEDRIERRIRSYLAVVRTEGLTASSDASTRCSKREDGEASSLRGVARSARPGEA